ncbi:7065_t:CDS:2, partial [Acaulospora morrowiae]
YRAPVDSPVSHYFKTFPLKSWSHKHFYKYTDTLDLEQVTRLWYDNITTIKFLPGSVVDEKLFTSIVRRKMANVFDVNEKKRKHAEDEVHTNSVTMSAGLLKDTFEHHRKYIKRKLGVSPPVTSVVNRSSEALILELKTDSDDEPDTEKIKFDQYIDNENFIQEKLSLNNLYILETNVDDTFYVFQEKNISTLFTSYQSEALIMGQTSGLSIVTDYHEILSLDSILLLQANKFSDLQVKKFSRNTLTSLRKNMCDIHASKVKVTSAINSIFREYVEIAIDEDLGLEKAEKAIKESFTKKFPNPTDQEMFDIMQLIFLQLPVLRSFFHDSMLHSTIWPNAASISTKSHNHKLVNTDLSRAKQPDGIGNVTNNNKPAFEVMYGENTGEGKNNNIRKNTLDLIRIGIFIKEALDNVIKETGRCFVIFRWQTVVNSMDRLYDGFD